VLDTRAQSLTRHFIWAVVFLGGVVLSFSDCGSSSATPIAAATPPHGLAVDESGRNPSVAAADVLTVTVGPPAAVSPAPSDVLTLTMWTTEAFSPLQDDLGSQLLRQQVSEFTAENPQIAIDFVLKKAYGKGGIRDFLETTGAVVPQRLPDLAILDIVDVPALAGEGLLRPLETLVSQELQDGLFPFAAEGCTVEDHLVGIQFKADLFHLAFNSQVLEAPPLTWEQVLSGTASYVFPAGGEDGERVNQPFWLQYLALGEDGSRLDAETILDKDRLNEVFQYYRQGVDAKVIPSLVLDYRTEADTWSAYLSGEAVMADVSSLRYLSSRSGLHDTGFAQVPTRDGRAFSLAEGWAVVIVAADQDRQAASARFLEWLLRPENNGAWTRATDRLPATRQALATWDQSDSYVLFAGDLLERAKPHPSGPNYDLVAKVLQRSLRDVLTDTASPEEAAAAAAGAIE
jgi:multiple sugar transport system substrate-binding protein